MQTKQTDKINLNTQQKKAVDNIFGPLLVLAGPGTGKTQLLASRVANILQKTLSCVRSSYVPTDHQPESKETVTSH